MMRDWIFFPLMGAAMLGMAAFALAPGPDRLRTALAPFSDPAAGLSLEGEALATLQVAEGLSLDLHTLDDGRGGARIAAFRPVDQPPFSQGVFVTLPPDFIHAFAGRTVRISVEGRAAPLQGSPHFGVAYFGGEGRDSGWRPMALSGAMAIHEFEWEIPPGPAPGAKAGKGRDVAYIGVWPDPEGRGRMMDLVSIRMQAIDDPS